MEGTAPESDVERYRRLDAAFRAGDMTALRRELADVSGFPNVIAHPAIGACLPYAIYHSPLRFVQALLEAGADPDWPNDDGFPPLLAAVSCAAVASGRADVYELVEMLLVAGADVGGRGNNDYTPLHLAAAQGDLRVVDALLAAGADPDEITRIDNFETALEIAAAAGHESIVARLAPLTMRLDWEEASSAGEVAELARLIATGNDIDARDRYGQTALMRAALAGHSATVRWLVERGADLDHAAKFGLTALMLAVVAEHPRVVRVLVAAGADLTTTGTGAPGFQGKTAADLAERSGDMRLARFLRAHTRRGPSER